MRKILIPLILLVALPVCAQVLEEGIGPFCSVIADGTVEVRLVSIYLLDDPERLYIYSDAVRVLHDEESSVMADWFPVAVQIYGKDQEVEIDPRRHGRPGRDRVTKRTKMVGGCGKVPRKPVSKDPKNEVPLFECEVDLDKPMTYYMIAYYLHPDPENPAVRFQFRSEDRTTEEPMTVTMGLGYPLTVQWWFRKGGTLAHYPAGDWELLKECDLPEGAVY